jgi:hypothetical protein
VKGFLPTGAFCDSRRRKSEYVQWIILAIVVDVGNYGT